MTEKQDGGGPAFPCEGAFKYYFGMSLRDYFAGQALAGMLADINIRVEGVEKTAYSVADAMLKERAKT